MKKTVKKREKDETEPTIQTAERKEEKNSLIK